jgi:hypothetical protein
VDDFRRVSFQGKGHEVSDLDLLISTFEKWAQALYPYGQNILDFSRTVETELGRPQVRSRLMDYRQDYIRTIVQAPAEQPAPAPQPVETQEELMRKKEENRRLALEKLRQRQAELKVATEQQQSADVVMEMTPERQHQS